MIPESLCRLSDESIPTYRDRLYHAFRIPVGLAGLNDLKAGHTEIANPLLSGSIVRTVRRMPDNLRTNKRAYAEFVREISPSIPFARFPADDACSDYLSTQAFVQYICDRLHDAKANDLLPANMCQALAKHVQESAGRSRSLLRFALKRTLPNWMIRGLRTVRGPEQLDRRILGLRAAMTIDLMDMFKNDAGLLATDR